MRLPGPNSRGSAAATILAGVLLAGATFAAPDEDAYGDEPAFCKDVRAGEAIRFGARTLIETPDIRAPELRRANVLVSARCFARADAVLAAYAQSHPDDHRIHFVFARIAWIGGQRDRAEAIANAALRAHPDFTSMKVLLASMRVDDEEYKTAQRWLDEVEAVQPDDLWAYIDRLRIEAALMPSATLGDTLRDIAKDARFPPSVRRQASQTALLVPDAGGRRDDEIFGALMDDPITADDCRLANKAEELIEIRNDPAAASALLEQYIGKNAKCFGTAHVRTVLAHAYLLQAAAIAPKPGPSTARLYDQARAVLQDDFTPLAHRIAGRPHHAQLIPFLAKYVDHDALDEDGSTVLCNAVMALNAPMVSAELERGARAHGECHGDSLVNAVLLKATREKVPERQAVLRALLEHGAVVEGLEFCASPANGDCRIVLLPILEEYAKRPRVTRT